MRITLCGSTRFRNHFDDWNIKLTLAGHVVYSLAAFGKTAHDVNKPNENRLFTYAQKLILDRVHKEKILNSDAIFVINTENRYIGDSTRSEIAHALNYKKEVWWDFWPNDENIGLFFPHNKGAYDSLFKCACMYSFCPDPIHKPGVCVGGLD